MVMGRARDPRAYGLSRGGASDWGETACMWARWSGVRRAIAHRTGRLVSPDLGPYPGVLQIELQRAQIQLTRFEFLTPRKALCEAHFSATLSFAERNEGWKLAY